MKLAILGGTGRLGPALAVPLAKKNEVRIGSRNPEKAESAAYGISGVKGGSNGEVAAWCEAAIATVPYEAVASLAGLSGALSGKLVLSAVNPIRQQGGLFQYALEHGSAAELLSTALPGSRVATAFNNVPVAFFGEQEGAEVDVLVAAESRETYVSASEVVGSVPRLRPVYVGPLSQAQSVERLTVLVLNASRLRGGPKLSVKFV